MQNAVVSNVKYDYDICLDNFFVILTYDKCKAVAHIAAPMLGCCNIDTELY